MIYEKLEFKPGVVVLTGVPVQVVKYHILAVIGKLETSLAEAIKTTGTQTAVSCNTKAQEVI